MNGKAITFERMSYIPVTVDFSRPDVAQYAKGGLARAAKKVAGAGEGGDSMLVHVNRSEFEEMVRHFGPPELNPETGMYSFKPFWKQKWFKQWAAPVAAVALSVIAPGLGTAIGAGLGLTGTAASAAGNALIGAGLGGVTGGTKGAITGGLAGGLTSLAAPALGLTAAPTEGGGVFEGGVLSQGGALSGVGNALGVPAGSSYIPPEALAQGVIENPNFIGPVQPPASSATGGAGGGGGAAAAGGGAGRAAAAAPSLIDRFGQVAGLGMIANAVAGGAGLTGRRPQTAGAPPGVPGGQQAYNDANNTQRLPEVDFSRERVASSGDPLRYGIQGGEQEFFEDNSVGQVKRAAQGGLLRAARGHYVKGDGHGREDKIPALLSDGEYVFDAETVSMLGDGSSDAGARRLDEMRQRIRKHKAGGLARGRMSPDAKDPSRYLKMAG